jgi:glycosyl transferase family 87
MLASLSALLMLPAAGEPAFAAGDQPAPKAGDPVTLPPVSPTRALEIANRTAEVRDERSRHPDLRAGNVVLLEGSSNWNISYRSQGKVLADVVIDGHTGRVIEAWQGVQADWLMARGHSGYFGKRFEDWYIWIPLCLLFLAPFFDPRRPFRMLHVDLLVLVGGFGLSHLLFNRGEIGTSVPLVYPVLGYFLVRLLIAGFRPRQTSQPLVPFVPAVVLVAGIVLLGGFRIGLDLTEGTVSDVGYASAVGATRIQDNKPLYVDSGADDQHFDTYGPVNYLAYDPFVRIWRPTREQIEAPRNYDVTAARAAAIAFDLLTIVGLFLLGIRLRSGRSGRMLGLALAYGWVSFPYTLFPLMSNGNDTLISALLVFALLGLTSAPARGALIALAGAAKFAPLALAPLFASGRGDGKPRAWMSFSIAAALVGVFAVLPYVSGEGGLKVAYDQTIGFQLTRESPFSVWGQNPGLEPLLWVVKIAAAALAVAVAFVPRRRNTLQVAALGAAVLIATQFVAMHWFYLYIVWFAPFLFVALFGEYSTVRGRARVPAPQPVREPVRAPRELVGAG